MAVKKGTKRSAKSIQKYKNTMAAKRAAKNGNGHTQSFPLALIPERPTRVLVARRNVPAAKLILAAEIVRLLHAVLEH